ncbi:hypothetical protein BGZ83_001335 [Gryganskiella cystojenkinii]|nr:hypothetical protein BGZ83_001335 [Gryganskiella cystojenkinii]
MSQKDAERLHDQNQDGMNQPPPPSYAPTANSSSGAKYAPPTGAPPTTESFYQAHPTQQYAPPAGAYIPPSGSYAPPTGNPNTTVVYVVDDAANGGNGGYMGAGGAAAAGNRPRGGIPMALICFILGLCTWVGYLFGMCFLKSPDPRERWWARACAIMCIVWGVVVIFASIFGRPNNNNYNGGNYYNGGYN